VDKLSLTFAALAAGEPKSSAACPGATNPYAKCRPIRSPRRRERDRGLLQRVASAVALHLAASLDTLRHLPLPLT